MSLSRIGHSVAEHQITLVFLKCLLDDRIANLPHKLFLCFINKYSIESERFCCFLSRLLNRDLCQLLVDTHLYMIVKLTYGLFEGA